MSASSREFWGFWQYLFRVTEFDPLTVARVRRVSRMLCAACTGHSTVRLDLSRRPDARLYAHWAAGACPVNVAHLKTRGWKGALGLPPTLVGLDLAKRFARSVDPAAMPRSLLALELDLRKDQVYDFGALPPSLTLLRFGFSYDREVDTRTLARALRVLEFGHAFDKPISTAGLPRSLTSLRFGRAFDRHLDTPHLPEGLVHLRLGNAHRRSLDVANLPRGMRELELGESFRDTFRSHDLPRGLTCFEAHVDLLVILDPRGMPPLLVRTNSSVHFVLGKRLTACRA